MKLVRNEIVRTYRVRVATTHTIVAASRDGRVDCTTRDATIHALSKTHTIAAASRDVRVDCKTRDATIHALSKSWTHDSGSELR